MSMKYGKPVIGPGLGIVLSLVLQPLRAEQPALVGTLRSDGVALVNDSPARSGMPVYSGDRLNTEEGQMTVSLKGGELLRSGRHTKVTVQMSENGLMLHLATGQLAWAGSAPVLAGVEADGLLFSPSATSRTTVEITLRNAGSIVMAVHRGSISVARLRPQAVTVVAGQVLIVEPRRAGLRSGSQTAPDESVLATTEEPRVYRIEKRSRRDLIPPLLIGGVDLLALIPHPLDEEETRASPWIP